MTGCATPFAHLTSQNPVQTSAAESSHVVGKLSSGLSMILDDSFDTLLPMSPSLDNILNQTTAALPTVDSLRLFSSSAGQSLSGLAPGSSDSNQCMAGERLTENKQHLHRLPSPPPLNVYPPPVGSIPSQQQLQQQVWDPHTLLAFQLQSLNNTALVNDPQAYMSALLAIQQQQALLGKLSQFTPVPTAPIADPMTLWAQQNAMMAAVLAKNNQTDAQNRGLGMAPVPVQPSTPQNSTTADSLCPFQVNISTQSYKLKAVNPIRLSATTSMVRE